ncbi:MAG: hypothetical protein ABR520_12630 [Mycobacteriales bacterium]|nr:hypothetical protein [Frankia sp.]
MRRRLASSVLLTAIAAATLTVTAAPANAGCDDNPCDPPPMHVCYTVVKWRVCP